MLTKQNAALIQIVAGAVVGAAASLLCAAWASTWRAHMPGTLTDVTRRQNAANQQQAFVLMVTLSFQDESHKQAFLNFWQPLAAHVRAHEPGTLAFEVLQSNSSPTEVLVYERYVHKDYYLEVHRTSAAMAAFKQRLAAVSGQVEISGHFYNELDIRFML